MAAKPLVLYSQNATHNQRQNTMFEKKTAVKLVFYFISEKHAQLRQTDISNDGAIVTYAVPTFYY